MPRQTVRLRTASHNLGLGTTFGSTPEHELPSFGNKNAAEVIGEGIALLVDKETGGEVYIFFEDGREFRLTRRGDSINIQKV